MILVCDAGARSIFRELEQTSVQVSLSGETNHLHLVTTRRLLLAAQIAAGHPPSDTLLDEKILFSAATLAVNGRAVSVLHVRKNPSNEGHVMSTVLIRSTRDHVQLLPSGTTPEAHSPFALREYHDPKSCELSVHWPHRGLNPVDASFPTRKFSFPTHVGGYPLHNEYSPTVGKCDDGVLR